MSKKNLGGGTKRKNDTPSPGIKYDSNLLVVGLCILITGSIYIYSALHNQLTNWDDNIYVSENHLITTWNTGLLTSRVNANWAPVHQLLLSVQYHLFGLNATGYHITSLLLHLCNAMLVFAVAFKLSNKQAVAGITALLFGIHPMHAEPVLWISAQKDLLYTLFYLAAMLSYARYQDRKSHSSYTYLGFTMLFFILSCLSKGMGETLPITLVLMDCLKEDNWNWKFIAKSSWNKIIFFLISIGFGITAYLALLRGGALSIPLHHSFMQQIMFVCYSLLVYLAKYIVPISLSPLYFYPGKDASGMYPTLVYLSPVILLLLSAGLFWLVRKRKNAGKPNNILFFGILFFAANMLLVLQLKAITVAMLAERYTYLSYLGFIFVTANGLCMFGEKNLQQYKTMIVVAACAAIITCWLITHNYANNWHDSISLWTCVIDNYQPNPQPAVSFAYNSRGLAHAARHDAPHALEDYTTGIHLNSANDYIYNNRGLLYAAYGKAELALADYDSSINQNPLYFAPYYNRGLIYSYQGKRELAIASYSTAIKLKPDYAEAYNDRGLAYAKLENFEQAIADYNKAIALIPDFVLPYYNRGLTYARLNKTDSAMADFNKAISLNPRYADVYNDRGLAFAKQAKLEQAIADYNLAISLKPGAALPYFNRGRLYAGQGKQDLAIQDYSTAIHLNPKYVDAYNERAQAEELTGNLTQAQIDLEKAKALIVGQPQAK